jgi:hypothetical protein
MCYDGQAVSRLFSYSLIYVVHLSVVILPVATSLNTVLPIFSIAYTNHLASSRRLYLHGGSSRLVLAT